MHGVEKVAGVNADRHFDKGESFERQQAKLDDVSDVELIIAGCYFAAHHFICAGADWHGQPHPQTHSHGSNAGLLRRSAAPNEVELAWGTLERLRAGSVYGGKPGSSSEARAKLAVLKAWVEAGRP
jgi:hypothetical protein